MRPTRLKPTDKSPEVIRAFASQKRAGRVLVFPNPVATHGAAKILSLFERWTMDLESIMETWNREHNRAFDGVGIVIFPFFNGRERGYTVRHGDFEASFTEARGGDELIVYPYPWYEQADEAAFEQRTKTLKSHEEYAAFTFILEFLGLNVTTGTSDPSITGRILGLKKGPA